MRQSYSTADQIMANANYKQAAHYDLDGSKIVLPGGYVGTLREATLYVLERIVCHTNYRGTLHLLRKDAETVWIATKPLDDGPWEAVPFLQLLVFREGRLVYEGKGGSQEYFDPEKNFEYKHLDFANL